MPSTKLRACLRQSSGHAFDSVHQLRYRLLILFAQGPVHIMAKIVRLGKKEEVLENYVFQYLLFFALLLTLGSPVPERKKLSSVSDDNFWSRRVVHTVDRPKLVH